MGQRSIIAKEKTNLKAVALDTMDVCYVPKQIIIDSLENNLSFTQATLETRAIDLRFAENALVNMAQKTVRQPISDALRYLESNLGVDDAGYLILVLKTEDIANLVGAAKEAGICTLTTFKKYALIATDGKRIKILNDKAL